MKTIRLKELAMTHAAIGALIFLLFGTRATNIESLSFLFGSLVSLLSFLILFVSFRNIFEKKHVALSVGLIVIKYLILGLLIYGIATSGGSYSALWFAVGIGLLFLSLSIYGLYLAKKNPS